MTRWCRLNEECRSEAGCAKSLTPNGRYPCADPSAHGYVAAATRPEDGCRHCGYVKESHHCGGSL